MKVKVKVKDKDKDKVKDKVTAKDRKSRILNHSRTLEE